MLENNVKKKWVAKAKEVIGYDDPSSANYPKDALETNRRITIAYSDMFLYDPFTYKWAGMAVFGSTTVGINMMKAQELAVPGFAKIPGITDVLGKKMLDYLKIVNLYVYADIFWQHLAYKENGLSELKKAKEQGDLHEDLYNQWEKIDEAKRIHNEDLCFTGSLLLLKCEQQNTFQKMCDVERDMWKNLSSGIVGVIHPIESQISTCQTFNDFAKKQGYDPDIGNFDQRWEWVEKGLSPKWEKMLSDIENIKKQVRELRDEANQSCCVNLIKTKNKEKKYSIATTVPWETDYHLFLKKTYSDEKITYSLGARLFVFFYHNIASPLLTPIIDSDKIRKKIKKTADSILFSTH